MKHFTRFMRWNYRLCFGQSVGTAFAYDVGFVLASSIVLVNRGPWPALVVTSAVLIAMIAALNYATFGDVAGIGRPASYYQPNTILSRVSKMADDTGMQGLQATQGGLAWHGNRIEPMRLLSHIDGAGSWNLMIARVLHHCARTMILLKGTQHIGSTFIHSTEYGATMDAVILVIAALAFVAIADEVLQRMGHSQMRAKILDFLNLTRNT